MATTYVDYTATAAQTDFAFSFPYLEDEHVTVEINGVATTLFSIVTTPATKVVLDSGATAGDIVRVRRRSQRDTNLVDFQNGSVLTEAELDRAYLHNRYLAEEISELNDASMQIEAGGTEWDAKGLRIKNVGSPTDTTDASTKLYVDNKVNQGLYGSDAPLKWQFTGTAGTNTTYTVTGAEISGDTVYDVSINGLVQEPTVDYTVNPDTDTLTIKTTLAGGEDIVIIQRGFGVAVTGTVGSNQLVNGSVTTEKIEDGAVTTAKIDTGAVTTAKIDTGAVTTAKIDADAVNGSKIADDSIDSEHYVDGSIDTAHIADDAVTSGKISSTDEVFNIKPSGNVGIGTTDDLHTLDVKGSLQVGSDETGDYTKIILSSGSALGFGSAGQEGSFEIKPQTIPGTGTSDHATYFKNATGSVGNSTQHNVIVDGNVGIGTRSPDIKLHVKGDSLGVEESGGTVQRRVQIEAPTALRDTRITNVFTDSGFRFLNNPSGDGTTFVDLFRITSGGNIGIGTSSPAYELDVVGDINASGEVRNSGVILTSDDRVKHNEEVITNALATLAQLTPKKYIKTTEMYEADHNFELDAEGRPVDEEVEYKVEAGVIAQDVLQVEELAFAVTPETTNENGEVVGPHGVNYNSLFTYAVAAIKEQQAIIEDLKARVEALEA